MPATIEPMLATLESSVPSGSDWLYEIKWDGYRSISFIDNGKVRMLSRRGNPMENQFPEIANALAQSVKADNAILDGEVVALDENGNRPAFSCCRIMPASGTATLRGDEASNPDLLRI